ncbi:MAG: tetratricopeptide repeat protein [Planctomycetes bacterium]|nr:tetratricopeptide repeat protein [Planctomycetota bacterium]
MDDSLRQFKQLLNQITGKGLAGSIDSLILQMEPDEREHFKLCAIPHQFDLSTLMAIAPDLEEEQAKNQYKEFSGLSIILSLRDELAMHDEARLHLFNQWLDPKNAVEFTTANERLVSYYEKRATEATGVVLHNIENNLMFHLLGVNQVDGFLEFERLFRQMRYQFRLNECKTLINLAHEYNDVLTPDHAASLTYHEGKLAADLCQWDLAEQLLNSILTNGKIRPELRIKVCNRLGIINQSKRNWYAALGMYHKALQLAKAFERSGNLIYRILHNLGTTYRDSGDLKESSKLLHESIKLAKDNADLAILALAYNSLGTLHRKLGNASEAIEVYKESLNTLQKSNDKFRMAQVYNNLGMTYADLGEWEQSKQYFEQSLEIKRQGGDTLGQAMTLNNLARVYRNLDNNQEAIVVSHQAINLFKQMKDHFNVALVKRNLGKLYRSLKNIDLSKKFFIEAIELFKRSDGCREAETAQKELEDLTKQKKGLPWWCWGILILVGLVLLLMVFGFIAFIIALILGSW